MANPLDLVRGRTGVQPTPPSSRAPGRRAPINAGVQQAIIQVAGQYGVDPSLLLAIHQQENDRSDPNMIGTSGEVGLFQIMPTTAIAYIPNVPGNTPQEKLANVSEMLKDPLTNTRIAAQHVKRLNATFQGDPTKIFAAYNAGEGAVAKAVAAGGDNWQQVLDTNRRVPVSNYINSATGLRQAQAPGGPPSSTGAQRDILRATPPEGPTIGLAPGIPVPVGVPPPAAPVPAVVPPPPTRPQPPMGPPTPPERTPVSPAPPPGTRPTRATEYPIPGSFPVPGQAAAPARQTIETPTGPQEAWSADDLKTAAVSTAPTPPAGPPRNIPPDYPIPAPFPKLADIAYRQPPAPPPVTAPTTPPVPAGYPDMGGIQPVEPLPVQPSRPVQPMPSTGANLPNVGDEFHQVTPSVPGTWDLSSGKLVVQPGEPYVEPPGPEGPPFGAPVAPSLGTVPQEARTPGLPPPPIAPQADMNAALGGLTDEELLDLAQWLEEQDAGGAGAPIGAPGFPQPYHMNIAGGLPAVRPQRLGFADESLYPWEGGR